MISKVTFNKYNQDQGIEKRKKMNENTILWYAVSSNVKVIIQS